MKQTAVEWFFNALIENQDKTHKQIESIFEQAKEMEREQNHAEYMRGWKDGLTKQQEQ
jgi:hypothetical protein